MFYLSIGALFIAYFVMPVIGIFAFLFLFPTFFLRRSIKKKSNEYRMPSWATDLNKLNRFLLVIFLIEFFALLMLHTFIPNALTWW
tara:strand:+ start:398616 stop:398873 length:258 start_codon:yes stop_codon:yes gene_type:complete